MWNDEDAKSALAFIWEVFVSNGFGEVLGVLMSYPVAIGCFLVAVISISLLMAKRKSMKKELKLLLTILASVTVILILLLAIMAFMFGSNLGPETPPVPIPIA